LPPALELERLALDHGDVVALAVPDLHGATAAALRDRADVFVGGANATTGNDTETPESGNARAHVLRL
jgi:hypothetical protein